MWTGSQIPVYLFGGVPPYIYRDIGGAGKLYHGILRSLKTNLLTDRWIWFVLANLLSLVCFSDLVDAKNHQTDHPTGMRVPIHR